MRSWRRRSEREALVGELKKVLRGYLAPLGAA
jgi:hypothetical protein